jgi:hypothetical protein
MKLKRLMMASALCLTLSAPSAFASEHGSGWFFSLFNHHDQQTDQTSHTGPDHTNTKRQCDQNGQDSGRGNNCDHGKGNGGGYCGTGGTTDPGSGHVYK